MPTLCSKTSSGFSLRIQTDNLQWPTGSLCLLSLPDGSPLLFLPIQVQWHWCPCNSFNASGMLPPQGLCYLHTPAPGRVCSQIVHSLISFKPLLKCHLLREDLLDHLLKKLLLPFYHSCLSFLFFYFLTWSPHLLIHYIICCLFCFSSVFSHWNRSCKGQGLLSLLLTAVFQWLEQA